jgi:NADPH2:quinone reductase
MRAIQITEQGSPAELQVVDIDRPVPGPGQVLIEVRAASVNYSDVMRRAGFTYPFPTPLPFIPGGEVAGVVSELGAGVAAPPVGTPVFALAGDDGSGGYAEYALAAAQRVIPIPPGLDFDRAASIVIAGVTATLLLTEIARLEPGQSVLVPAAAGGVGSYAVQIAQLLGAGKVLALAGNDDKRRIALSLGADHAIDPAPGWHRTVRDLTGGAGVDVALEMSGGTQLDEAARSLAPFGRLVVYGMAGGLEGAIAPETWTRLLYAPSLNQSILTYNLGLWFGLRTDRAVQALTDLIGWVTSGRIRTPAIHPLPLEKAAEAHRLLQERGTDGKLVLRP